MSTTRPASRGRSSGPGRILVAVYAVLAIAAAGRSVFQIVDRFDEAPIAFSLSALAAVVYIAATLALALGWDRVAWVTIGFELLGVLVIGTVSLVAPAALGLDSIDPFGREAHRLERVRRGLPVRAPRAADPRAPLPVAHPHRARR